VQELRRNAPGFRDPNKRHLFCLQWVAIVARLSLYGWAQPLQGVGQMADEIKGKTVVCVISGGNFDPKRFPEIKLLATS
jgi:hypothetical protein